MKVKFRKGLNWHPQRVIGILDVKELIAVLQSLD